MASGDHKPERTAKIVAMCASGLTLQQVGDQFGITRERVRQIVSAKGVARNERGANIRARAREQNVRGIVNARRVARVMRGYGCSPEEAVRLNEGVCLTKRSSFARQYTYQRKNAEFRGIAFNLTFPQWMQIWRASGRLTERGRGHGKYVMSRFGDVGPYQIGNVFIQLADENCSEGNKRAWARRRVAEQQAA